LSLSLYEASIPVYLHMLRNVLGMLDKAEGHANAEGVPFSAMLDARLAPDMHPLTRQLQTVSDAAKNGAARLAGMTPPSFPDVETTLPELRERLSKTIDFVSSITPEQVNGREEEIIELKFPQGQMTFTGRNFLLQFSLPNFFFHVVTAYGLMRSQGVPLGKMDYLAGARA
jgi:uncharacterized protein